jgi:hypothetical protein
MSRIRIRRNTSTCRLTSKTADNLSCATGSHVRRRQILGDFLTGRRDSALFRVLLLTSVAVASLIPSPQSIGQPAAADPPGKVGTFDILGIRLGMLEQQAASVLRTSGWQDSESGRRWIKNDAQSGRVVTLETFYDGKQSAIKGIVLDQVFANVRVDAEALRAQVIKKYGAPAAERKQAKAKTTYLSSRIGLTHPSRRI